MLNRDIELKLMSLGWWDSQRKKAESDPDLANAWADLAMETAGIGNPGAFSWSGFCSGAEPVKAKPDGWTGIKFIRGSHSGTYVWDAGGYDHPPPGYAMPERKAA